MGISTKRIYQEPEPGDGRRILVDRLWPRGVSRERARVDYWARDTAVSDALRRWYDHRPERWAEFRQRYFAELDAHPDAVSALREALGKGDVTLLFASRECALNNATALRDYLEGRTQPTEDLG